MMYSWTIYWGIKTEVNKIILEQGEFWSVKIKSRPKLIMLVIDVDKLQAKGGTETYLKAGVKK